MSSTAATSAGPAPARAWIVSAGWDLAYIVATPLLVVPVVLILARRALTPEEVSLAVIAFASLGHHLPGFMRTYGDRDLFRRYRVRLLVAPLAIFAVALLFSPPTRLAAALGLPWKHLHGLELILLVWGTWHGLMQTYGFMRIYDLRLGVHDRRTARLDHLLCLVVFVAGVVFSDARMFGIANAMWQAGLPIFGPEWLHGTRLAVGAASVAVIVAYVVNLVSRRVRGEPISWLKLLLVGITGWFYWYTGRLSTNLLIGLAMFEIYHAVQYYAIVWTYNRRLLEQAGERFGPLGFLFRDRWSMLGVYLAAIAAYSSIRYFNVDANEYVFRGGSEDAHRWLVALFVTSSTLHFYFDGFIWKVSEKKTQRNLVDEVPPSAVVEHLVPAARHAAKWAVLAAIVGGLLLMERVQLADFEAGKADRLRALAALTPELPECQSLLSRDALARGAPAVAARHAEQALALRPRSHTAYADLGLAQFEQGQLEAARQNLLRAVAMAPDHHAYHSDLGLVLAQQGETDDAERHLRRAVELRPDLEAPRQLLAEFYLRRSRSAEAERVFDEIAEQFPDSVTAEIGRVMLLIQQGDHEGAVGRANFLLAGNAQNWRVQLAYGTALNAAGAGDLAIGPLVSASRFRPRSADVLHQLGLAYFLAGDPSRAIGPLTKATRLAPRHFGVHFQLANTLYVLDKPAAALAAYARCYELEPRQAQLCANYGGLLAAQGQIEQAETIYRAGLAAHPDSGELNFNLGVLLWQQGRDDEARKLILNAEQLGVVLPADVREAVSR